MKAHRIFLTVTLITCLHAAVPAAESVRIDTATGVPLIQVDGRVVRSRVFFGLPGSRPLAADLAGQEIRFEFTPTEDERGKGTMHFRFGQIPGDLLLDNIHVTDLTEPTTSVIDCDFEQPDAFTRQWHIWPPENSVATVAIAKGVGVDKSSGLHIQLRSPTDGNWPDFHIYHHPDLILKKSHRYRVSLWVRATPVRGITIAFYRPGQVYTFLGGPPRSGATRLPTTN